jgi:glycosyltransferase involved in cell wall biosynthesis
VITVVIPAYNEEKLLPATLEAVELAAQGVGSVELIVVDNESTDRTREIAAGSGAKVISESVHNISRVRNAGAQAASGEVIVFIDADTLVRPGVIEKILEAMSDKSCLGGSVGVEYGPTERRHWVNYYLLLALFVGRILRMHQGALQFCRVDVFREVGGYDETIYVGEDVEFFWRLDKVARSKDGRIAFLAEPKVQTSSRRWERMGLFRMLVLCHPITIMLAWRKGSFWRDWYDDAIR